MGGIRVRVPLYIAGLAALRAIERLPRWRRVLGAFNPVSLRGSLASLLTRSPGEVRPSRGGADG